VESFEIGKAPKSESKQTPKRFQFEEESRKMMNNNKAGLQNRRILENPAEYSVMESRVDEEDDEEEEEAKDLRKYSRKPKQTE